MSQHSDDTGRNGGKDTGRYTGHERRSGKERRHHDERREEIRFEPDKDERRSGKDRRHHGGWDNTSDRR